MEAHMREVIVDTETTGIEPADGHRVVEIACLELSNHVPTGRSYQAYLNPERDVPADAFAIHGLSTAFLADKPRFADVADHFLKFLGDASLVIHNAEFDMRFLNAELTRIGRAGLDSGRAIDTLMLARRKFPGAPASLDALCKRFAVDNSTRTLHGAMLDVQLLAEVYLELIGGRQTGLDLAPSRALLTTGAVPSNRAVRPTRPHTPTEQELARHAALIAQLKEPLWHT
jgi:DNA polymerase-3 subunit epsilon